MSISFATLNGANAEAARSLLERFWHQPWSADFTQRFFAWRYLERSNCEVLLAFDGDRCVATLGSVVRGYANSENLLHVRETFDWFCLPEYRQLGIGLRLIKQMMDKPEPMIVIGGTAATRTLLPRLRWRSLGQVENHFLPVSGRMVAAFALRKMRSGSERFSRAIPKILKIRRPARIAAPRGSAQVTASLTEVPNESFLCKSVGYALAPIIDRRAVEWLARGPAEVGKVLTLFFRHQEMSGMSLSRVENRPEGPTAKIMHIQSSDMTPEMADWIVSETSNRLIDCGAGFIFCRASCPIINGALRRIGYLPGRKVPAFWWSHDAAPISGMLHLTRMIGDDSIDFVL